MRPPGRTRAASAGASSMQRIGEDVGDDDVERRPLAARAGRPATNVASTPLRARVGAARDERLRVDVGADDARRRRAGTRRSRGCRSRSRSRARDSPRAQLAREPFEAQPRGRMRAGAEREPGIEREIDRRRVDGGSHHDGTIQSPSVIRIGANCACVARTQSCSATAKRLVRRQRAAAIARQRAPAPPAIGRAAANSAVSATDRPARRRRLAGLAVERRLVRRAGARDRRCRPTARRRRAARPPTRRRRRRRRRSAGRCSSRARDGPRRARAGRARVSPPACASRASLRDSGSTCRRAGTSRRAAAPGAAGCWS